MSGTASPLASPKATREMLESFGLATKHRLGQNFLVDNHVVECILDLAELDRASRVLEVGPGIGTLTLALLRDAGAVVSIEADAELEQVLGCHAGAHPTFAYIMGDALAVPYATVCDAFAHLGAQPSEPSALVANLPYNVAATVILKYLAEAPSVRRLTVMVQKEVADRICAEPGTKAYGAYTAKLGLYGAVTGRFEVSPRCFMPAPHVDSAVVRIDRFAGGDSEPAVSVPTAPAPAGEEPAEKGVTTEKGAPAQGASAEKGARPLPSEARRVGGGEPACPRAAAPTHPFPPLDAAARAFCARVIDAAFAQRRKTIRNSMSASGFGKQALDGAFAACGIAPTCRAETLSTAEFVRLAAALDTCEGGE